MPSRTPSWTVSWVTSNRSSMKGSAASRSARWRGTSCAEFEQPDTKLELSGVPFQEPCIDERPDQAMDRRLGQTGFPHQIGEGQRRVVSVEDAQDPVDLAEHGTQLVPFSGSHLCIVTEAT